MDFPSGCFLWRGIFQQIRYFSVPGAFFFCRSCAGSCRVFPPSSRFLSGIFCVLRMLLAVFLSAIPVFFGSRSIFYCRSCAGSCRVFSPSSRFFIRNLLYFADAACRVFSSHTGTFFPFLPFPLMENLLLSCFCTDFLHGTDARAFARA